MKLQKSENVVENLVPYKKKKNLELVQNTKI